MPNWSATAFFPSSAAAEPLGRMRPRSHAATRTRVGIASRGSPPRPRGRASRWTNWPKRWRGWRRANHDDFQPEVHMNPISALVFIVFIGGAVLTRLAGMPVLVTIVLALAGIFLGYAI